MKYYNSISFSAESGMLIRHYDLLNAKYNKNEIIDRICQLSAYLENELELDEDAVIYNPNANQYEEWQCNPGARIIAHIGFIEK